MATALGAGACVASLPLADLGVGGWRLVYVVPLLGLLLVPGVSRRLQESRRFEAPHADAGFAGHLGRFWLLAISGMLLNLFVAPASAFQNRYLKNERGFSASRISAFTLLTNTPGGIGIIVGGRLADLRGRRVVGSIALFGGTICTVWFFVAQGWTMWLASAIGAIVGAAAVPALGVYSAELFPTSLRGKANAAITVLALIGSGVGLIAAGAMSDRWDQFAPGMALLALGPMVVCVLVLKLYPETARRELEELNPEDAVAPAP
jgi:MFS family permease